MAAIVALIIEQGMGQQYIVGFPNSSPETILQLCLTHENTMQFHSHTIDSASQP